MSDTHIVYDIKKLLQRVHGTPPPLPQNYARMRAYKTVPTPAEAHANGQEEKKALENSNNTSGQGLQEVGTNDPNKFVVPLLTALLMVYEKYGYLNILEVGAGNGLARQFILAILNSHNIRVQWVATDLIQRPHAPDVRCLSGLRAVTPGQGYIGFNVLLMLFPTPNDTWSTHVLERVTDLNIDCAVIFGGETGHSDGHISILPVLEQSWKQTYRKVFARIDDSFAQQTLSVIRSTMPEIAHYSDDKVLTFVHGLGTNEKAIELYFRR